MAPCSSRRRASEAWAVRKGFAVTVQNSCTRLDWMSRYRFDTSGIAIYGTWLCFYRRVSLTEALKTIETDGFLHLL